MSEGSLPDTPGMLVLPKPGEPEGALARRSDDSISAGLSRGRRGAGGRSYGTGGDGNGCGDGDGEGIGVSWGRGGIQPPNSGND